MSICCYYHLFFFSFFLLFDSRFALGYTDLTHYLLLIRHIPAYFEKNIDSGIPVLTLEGRKALEEELKSTDGES